MTPTQELFDLLKADIYTDAHEYTERVQRIKALIPEVEADIQTLADCLNEAHEDEVNENHFGDGPEGCNYCDQIETVTGTRPQAV